MHIIRKPLLNLAFAPSTAKAAGMPIWLSVANQVVRFGSTSFVRFSLRRSGSRSSADLTAVLDWGAIGAICRNATRPVEDCERAIRILPDLDRGFDEVMSDRTLRQLQSEPREGDCVVASDDALFLEAQDLG
ncbi:hypothetical protein, partial [Mesorhizobium sp. NFR06]|uniref:hypothetical protein n=1 Tax=Mesorhizobium sp. NFR06 TaxID=1566290 RepID=UPI001AEE250A